MLLLLQAAPLLVLVSLLVSGRATPVAAVLVALALLLPAVLLSLPSGTDVPAFLLDQTLRGVFLAMMPIGVVAGGLLFHAAVTGDGAAAAARPDPRRIFVATLLAGTFLEGVTGFAVGAVFALSSLRAMGLRGAPAGAMALLALCLVPWGALGPGTALAGALTGLPAQRIAAATSLPNAIWLLCLGPVLWRLCAISGVPVPRGERLVQAGVLAVLAMLLAGLHLVLPFEVIGILAPGLPLLAMLWSLDPPQGREGWRRALRTLGPYLILTAALLTARGWSAAPAWAPFAELPSLPITHVAVILWLVSGLLLLRRPDGPAAARQALARAKRPAIAMLLYVVMARWMAGSGIAASLAEALADALGIAAPFAVPVLGVASGIVTGSNVGSTSALMAVQQALGQAAGMPPMLAPTLHNFAGSAGAGMSFGATAMVCGLLADGTRPAQIWRLLLPSMSAVLAIGWIAVALSG